VTILKIGTRGSDLALVQARGVARSLKQLGRDSEIVVITTTGDRRSRKPDPGEIGKALWTLEIEQALATGEIDLAVHSLKDLPADLPEGLILGATPSRQDPRDVLIGREDITDASELPPGSRVGTGSVRRRAALLAANPELQVEELKGNVPTRLQRLEDGDFDAIVLAAAGLRRLGLEREGMLHLDPLVMPPALCQGIVGVEVREADIDSGWVRGLRHAPSWTAALAERAFLGTLQVGCGAPVGGLATVQDGRVRLRGVVMSPDGDRRFEAVEEGPTGEARVVGLRVGAALVDGKASELGEELRALYGEDEGDR